MQNSKIDVEPRCFRCDYNLSMLEHTRCPECGLAFDLNEVVAVARYRRTTPLFEYAWRRSPVGSLIRTFGLTLLPWRLWSHTPLSLEPRIKPLLALVPLTCLVYAILAFVRIQA